MNTPITDKLNMKFHEDESASFVDSYVGMRSLARRLEQDRAALMESLEACKDTLCGLNASFETPEEWSALYPSIKKARTAIALARANFPDED